MSDSFKHPSNFHRDPRVEQFIDESGATGYGLYWIVVEIVVSRPNRVAWYSPRSWAKHCGMRADKFLRFMGSMERYGLIRSSLDEGGFLHVELVDNFTSADSDNRCAASEWARLRAYVFERDNYICGYCGATGKLECDHKIPVSRGGSDDLSNLVTACFSCNRSKRAMTAEEFVARRRVQ